MVDKVDPISGNAIPPGATAKNVRDDVPIMASEGEYMIPANVVRYLGLKHIQKMVDEAKQALGDNSKQVEGGEDDDSLPFPDDELEWDDNPEEEASEGMQHLAAGGQVESPLGGSSGIKAYKDANGQTVYIPFFNGKPLYDIPQGYTEETSTPSTPEPTKNQPQINKTTGEVVTSDSNENKAFVDANQSSLAGSPKEWTVDDFVKYGKTNDGAGEKVGQVISSFLPMGKLAFGSRERYLDGAVPDLIDQMLKNKVDLQGNPLAEDQVNALTQAKQNLISDVSAATGRDFNPLSGLGDIFNNLKTSFSSNAPMQSVSSDASRMLNSYSTPGQEITNTSDNQYSGSGGSYGMGEDLGSDPSNGPTSGSMASGGLYKKGGLIKRRC